MTAEVEEARWVQGTSLCLVTLATMSAELAIAEPGRSAGVSLAWAVGWSLLALLGYAWSGRYVSRQNTRGRTSASPLFVIGMLIALCQPFALEACRLGWSGRSEPLEIVLVSVLRNLGIGLAMMVRKPTFSRLAAMLSLFLVLVTSSMADGSAVSWTFGAYAAAGGFWLVVSYWSRLRLPTAARGGDRYPVASLASALGFIGLVIAVAAFGPARAVTALAGLMPSSGGTEWDNPDGRGGVNDGENEVKGADKPQSIGFAETDAYLDSDRPSLYDAFNDLYGEPIKPKRHDRMIALNNQNIQEQKERPAENLRAGRQFSAVRRSGDRAVRRPSDREAKALLYVKGPTPLHLGLAAYDRFDGRQWEEEESPHGRTCPLVLESEDSPWFRLNSPVAPLFSGVVSHQIKIGTLDSSPLPLPSHVCRFRIGQVNRRDFFDWSHEGMMRMVGRSVPSSTMIESEAMTIDPRSLWDQFFPDSPYAAPRLHTIEGERGIAPEVAALAREWANGLPRGWGQIEAIIGRLRRHADHDRGAVAPPDCDDVVAHFLLGSRRGPDYQFATAAAVLLRSLNYPTRLVSGFYAAPNRYDPRTRHTSVTQDDVHVWAEVRLPGGTWVEIEPTPGYELMGPSLAWSERVRAAIAFAWFWVRSHAGWLGVVAFGLAGLAAFRRDLADAILTLTWRARSSRDLRRSVIGALRLVERRSRWSGNARPPGRTPTRWYTAIAPASSMEAADLHGLIRLAQWALYAVPDSIPPKSCDDEDPRETCHRAVAAWTFRRFRALDRTTILKELAR